MRLRADGRPPLRIAHRGLTEGTPDNSLAAIEAALAADVDVVEVDVAEVAGRLVLAHSPDVAEPDAPSLEEALAFFAERAAPSVAVQLDLKPRRGAEARVVEAVRDARLGERTFFSSTYASVLRQLRRLEPDVTTAFGYPQDRGGIAQQGRLPEPAIALALNAMRASMPLRAGRLARRARADALSLHHLVVSRAVVRRCHALGLAVLAWTVNDREELGRMLAAGVDGVVTDDPGIMGR